jgi:hypothetical protein
MTTFVIKMWNGLVEEVEHEAATVEAYVQSRWGVDIGELAQFADTVEAKVVAAVTPKNKVIKPVDPAA